MTLAFLRSTDHLHFSGGASGKEPTCQCRKRRVWFLGWEKSPGGGHGNPLQYSCLENSMDRGAWGLQSIGSQSLTQLKWLSTHTQTIYFVEYPSIWVSLMFLSDSDLGYTLLAGKLQKWYWILLTELYRRHVIRFVLLMIILISWLRWYLSEKKM